MKEHYEITNAKKVFPKQDDINFVSNAMSLQNHFCDHYLNTGVISIIFNSVLCLSSSVRYEFDDLACEEKAIQVFHTPTELKNKILNGDLDNLSDFEKIFIPLFEIEAFNMLFQEVEDFNHIKFANLISKESKNFNNEYKINKFEKQKPLSTIIKSIESTITNESHLIEKIGLLLLKTALTDSSEQNQVNSQLLFLLHENKDVYQERKELFLKAFRQQDCSFNGYFDMSLREYFSNSHVFFDTLNSVYLK